MHRQTGGRSASAEEILNSGNKKTKRKKEKPGLLQEELWHRDGGAAIYAQTYKLLTKCLHHLIQSHHVYSVIYYYDLMCKLMALKCLRPLNIQQQQNTGLWTARTSRRRSLFTCPPFCHAASASPLSSPPPPFLFLSLPSLPFPSPCTGSSGVPNE